MSRPEKLTLVVKPEYDPARGGVLLVGRLSVFNQRLISPPMLETRAGNLIFTSEARAMAHEVAAHLRAMPLELERLLLYYLNTHPGVELCEYMRLEKALREANRLAVEAVLAPPSDSALTLSRLTVMLSGANAEAAYWREKYRHESLRGRLFKKGKKARVHA